MEIWSELFSHYQNNYNVVRPLPSIQLRKSEGSLLTKFKYTYDRIGNRTTMTDNLGLREYNYDRLYRLTKVKYSLVKEVSYTYDKVGNRSYLSTYQPYKLINYSYDSADRLLSAGNINYGYDSNGNLISKTDEKGTTSFDYDPENRPLSISYPSSIGYPVSSYEYAPYGKRIMFCPFGKRIKKTDSTGTRFYLHDEENVLMEFDETGKPINQYTTTLAVDEIISIEDKFGKDYYYLYDGLGSVAMLTDKYGDIVQVYNYDAFGKPNVVTQEKNPYKFTTREYDPDSQLYYYRARYYDPETGRFIQKDPLNIVANGNGIAPILVSKSIGKCMSYSFMPGLPSVYYSQQNLRNPQTLHKYVYALNNPLIYTDPFGLHTIVVKGETFADRYDQEEYNDYLMEVYDDFNKLLKRFTVGRHTEKGKKPIPPGTYDLLGPAYPSVVAHSLFYPIYTPLEPGAGYGIHAGRGGHRTLTLGCVRMRDADLPIYITENMRKSYCNRNTLVGLLENVDTDHIHWVRDGVPNPKYPVKIKIEPFTRIFVGP